MKKIPMTPENDKILGEIINLANKGAQMIAAQNAERQLQAMVNQLNQSMEEHNDQHSQPQCDPETRPDGDGEAPQGA